MRKNIFACPSSQKRMLGSKKQLGKVHLGYVRRERRFLSMIPSNERYSLSVQAKKMHLSEYMDETFNKEFPKPPETLQKALKLLQNN